MPDITLPYENQKNWKPVLDLAILQINGAVDELSEGLDEAVETAISEYLIVNPVLGVTTEYVDAVDASLAAEIDALTADVDTTIASVDLLTLSVNDNTLDLSDQAGQIEDLNTEVDGLVTELDDLTVTVGDKADAADLLALNDVVGALAVDVGALEVLPDLAVAPGSANNPHTTQGAARNVSLPKNYWRYAGTVGVDNPTNWVDGDEWINL